MGRRMDRQGSIHGIVLAGGQGRRMGGVNKASQRIGNSSLIELTIKRIRPQVGSISISANEFADDLKKFGIPVFEDIRKGHLGPLSGIESVLSQVKHNSWFFVCPTDTPFLPTDLVSKLFSEIENTETLAAFPIHGGKKEPLHCLIHYSVLPLLTSFLNQDRRSVLGFLESIHAKEVEVTCSVHDFINLNTLEEIDYINKSSKLEKLNGI